MSTTIPWTPIPWDNAATPLVVHGDEHPRDQLVAADFGVESPEDVVQKRGSKKGETAKNIAQTLAAMPKSKNHGVTPDTALANEKKRLAYAEVQRLWQELGSEGWGGQEVVAARTEIAQYRETIEFRRGEGNDEAAAVELEQELAWKLSALDSLIGASITAEQKSVLIAYGKKRLAQVASLEAYLRHANRKETMRAARAKINEEIKPMNEQLGALREQITGFGRKLEEELAKTPPNTIMVGTLTKKKEALEAEEKLLGKQIDDKVALLDSFDSAVKREGMWWASIEGGTQTVVTVAKLVAEREDIVKKLAFLDVSAADAAEIVMVAQNEATNSNFAWAAKEEKVTRLVRSDTGEPVTKMSDIIRWWTGEDKPLANITSLGLPTDNPCFYTADIINPQSRSRTILIKVEKGKPIALVGWDGRNPSSVFLTKVGEAKIIVSEAAGQQQWPARYTLFDQETGGMLCDIETPAKLHFDHAVSTLTGTIVEAQYQRGGDLMKWVVNIDTGVFTPADIESHYDLVGEWEKENDAFLRSEAERKYENIKDITWTHKECIKTLQQNFLVWRHAGGSLCLMSREDNSVVWYLDPTTPWWKNAEWHPITMLYKTPVFESNGEIDKERSYGDVYNIATQEEMYGDVSLRRSYDTPNGLLDFGKAGIFVKARDGTWMYVSYTTGVTSEVWKGNVEMVGRDMFMVVDQSRNRASVYYVKNRGQVDAEMIPLGELAYSTDESAPVTLLPSRIVKSDTSPIILLPIKDMTVKWNLVYCAFDKGTWRTQVYKGHRRIGDNESTLALYAEHSMLPKAAWWRADLEVDVNRKEGTEIRAVRGKSQK